VLFFLVKQKVLAQFWVNIKLFFLNFDDAKVQTFFDLTIFFLSKAEFFPRKRPFEGVGKGCEKGYK